MDIRYYLAPIVQIEIGPRSVTASKVLIYLDHSTGDSHASIMPNPYKQWALSWVEAGETTHAAIQADSAIRLIPFWDSGGNYLPLTAQVVDVVEPYRTNIATYLENHRIPTGWITGSMTLRRILRYIIQILVTVQRLEDDFPELDLDAQVSSIPIAQRQRINAWMDDNGIETGDITNSWSIRQVLQRIIDQYGWQAVYSLGTALL